MDKMTNKKAITYVLTNCEVPAEIKAKLETMLASLEKKSATGERKPTATQVANKGLKEILLANLGNEPKTVTEIIKSIPQFVEMEMSNQKCSALVKQLVDSGKVVKVTEKGKSLFYLA